MAQLLAEALGEQEMREIVHQAIQSSPFTEQKVVLSDFFTTAGGRRLISAVTERSGRTLAEIQQLAAILPAIDLYLPYATQRSSWVPSESIAVSALVDEYSPLVGYLAGGSTIAINRRSLEPPSVAVLLLGPAEVKNVRRLARACEQDVDFCDDGGGGGGGGSGPRLRIDTIATFQVCDNGLCTEGNEFEIHGDDSNGLYQNPFWRCTGIGYNEVVTVSQACITTLVHESAPTEVAFIWASVKETDGWPNPDDYWLDYQSTPGTGKIPKVVDNGLGRMIFLLYKDEPASMDCDPPATGGNLYCPHVETVFKW